MDLEKQVCSLELSKKLKKLGVEHDSFFYWSEDDDFIVSKDKIINSQDWKEGYFISAFTVAELGEMLPATIHDDGQNDLTTFKIDNKMWLVRYESEDRTLYYGDVIVGSSEANARAKLLVYLLENKLI